ncbi:MAG: S-layer homology domain-containing protein [Anaerovoracaceae bacterium]
MNCKGVMTLVITVFLFLTTGLCFGYSDVDQSSSDFDDIMLLTEAGYVSGYPDGTFRPSGTVTRAEFVRMTNQIFAFSDQTVSNLFSDVKLGDWFYEDVLISLKAGYLIGYPDGTFRPQGDITREEACAIIDRILQLSEQPLSISPESIVIEDGVSPWANDSVRRVLAAGLMSLDADGSFRAVEKATRADIASSYTAVLRQREAEGQIVPEETLSRWKSLDIDSEVGKAIDRARSIMDQEILLGSVLSEKQKEFVRDMSNALATYLRTGDEAKLTQSGNTIKAQYDRMPAADREMIEKEIRRCIPVTDLYMIKDYFL